MILRQLSSCKKCGYSYRINHYVKSNEVKKKLKKLRNDCPKCGTTLDNSFDEFSGNPLKLGKDSVRYLDANLVYMDDGTMEIDVDSLMQIGFHGILNVKTHGEVHKFTLDPVRNRIRQFK